MTIAERLRKLAGKEDGCFVSVGGLVIDLETAYAKRRRESTEQFRRDEEDDFMWQFEGWGGEW